MPSEMRQRGAYANRREPGGELCVALKAMDAARRGDPAVLHHVVDITAAGSEQPKERHLELRCVPLVELAKRSLLAAQEATNEHRIGGDVGRIDRHQSISGASERKGCAFARSNARRRLEKTLKRR